MKSRVAKHSSSLKQLDVTISMRFDMKSRSVWRAICLLATSERLEPDADVKACQEGFSSVPLVLDCKSAPPSLTLLDVTPTYVSITLRTVSLTSLLKRKRSFVMKLHSLLTPQVTLRS